MLQVLPPLFLHKFKFSDYVSDILSALKLATKTRNPVNAHKD